MGDAAWELFNALSETLRIQSRQITELEDRIAALEKRLDEDSRPVLTLVDNTPKREEAIQP